MEILLEGVVVIVGILLAVRFFRPLIDTMRILEQSKKPRGERGRVLLKRMGSRWGGGRALSLRGQDLRREDLRDAFLSDVDLSDTDLRGVDLTGANLGGAWLVGARYDEHTRWPEGFEPRRHGAVMVR